MAIFNELIEHIKKSDKTTSIVFAEGWNKDIVTAAKMIINEVKGKIIPILIFRTSSEIPSNLPKEVKTIVIDKYDLTKYANHIYELRKHKGISEDDAMSLAKKPNFLASTLVSMGEADGEICGIEYTTADTLKAALQIVKPATGVKTVCSSFIMEKGNERLVFGDSSVNIDPTVEQLECIVKSMAGFARDIAGIDDVRIALLSYSTAGSGKGESVDKVRHAYELIKIDEEFVNKNKVFGEIQFDAAYDVNVMKKKAKNLDWNAPANVFVFPNIDAGNIGYKIAQRMGKFEAIGPVVLGLSKPVNDLSRGASASDVANLSYITAVQALKAKK